MGVSVSAYATYLRDTYRVSRVVLPHSLTFDEVAAFTALDDLEIETPVQTGGRWVGSRDCVNSNDAGFAIPLNSAHTYRRRLTAGP